MVGQPMLILAYILNCKILTLNVKTFQMMGFESIPGFQKVVLQRGRGKQDSISLGDAKRREARDRSKSFLRFIFPITK